MTYTVRVTPELIMDWLQLAPDRVVGTKFGGWYLELICEGQHDGMVEPVYERMDCGHGQIREIRQVEGGSDE